MAPNQPRKFENPIAGKCDWLQVTMIFALILSILSLVHAIPPPPVPPVALIAREKYPLGSWSPSAKTVEATHTEKPTATATFKGSEEREVEKEEKKREESNFALFSHQIPRRATNECQGDPECKYILIDRLHGPGVFIGCHGDPECLRRHKEDKERGLEARYGKPVLKTKEDLKAFCGLPNAGMQANEVYVKCCWNGEWRC